ncbi:hypothetical protein SH528x_004953 [Novipirellula sp. SH528]|uniref:hypothetical protein n=1 Tax=Novipirellula sp. SH528 TaxID=3454466 RepID=UPI003F9FC254
MMTRREPIEVARLVASGRWKSEHIASYRKQFGDAALLDVLLCPFLDDCSTESLTHYDCQQSTGRLLLEIMPEYDRPLRQMIRQSLPLWNLSVEEWPFFLCRRYGIDAVSETIDQIAATDILNESEQRGIETLRYWLRAKPDTILGTPLPR